MAQQFCLHSMQREEFIENNFGKIRAPFSAGIELTARCNLRCIHCYAQNSRKCSEMSTEEVKHIIDVLCDNGMIHLFFTGGEVLCRVDFCELYIYAKRKGLIVSVLTNCTLLTDEHIRLFQEYPVSIISTTVYGCSEEVYERVTGVKGSFYKFKEALALMKENKIPFELKFVAMKQNIEDVHEFKKLGDELGVNTLVSFGIFPTTDKNQLPLSYRVSPQQAFEFDIQDKQRREFWNQIAIEHYERLLGKREPKEIPRRDAGCLYNCNISLRDTFINSQGKMQACIRTCYDQYDLLHGNFQDGWEFLEKEFRRKQASKDFICNRCDKLEFCEQCGAVFYRENGSAEIVDSFFCEVAGLRKAYVEKKVHELLMNKE